MLDEELILRQAREVEELLAYAREQERREDELVSSWVGKLRGGLPPRRVLWLIERHVNRQQVIEHSV